MSDVRKVSVLAVDDRVSIERERLRGQKPIQKDGMLATLKCLSANRGGIMSSRFFGQYLLEKGRITSQQLLDALECQKNIATSIGTMALERGLLTAEQIKQVLQHQRQINQRFGEIAVGLGYLTKPQWTNCSKTRRPTTAFG